MALQAGLVIEVDHAGQIWQRLDHINLTGAHEHNYRRGKGLVGDWKNWMTNAHLEIIREHGLEHTMEVFGYGRIEPLKEARYTPFQQCVAELVSRGKVFEDHADLDLFGFAFNKSNIDASAFAFRRYGWRVHSSVERSGFADEGIVMAVWEAAETAAGELNGVLEQLLAGDYSSEARATASVETAIEVSAAMAKRMPKVTAAMVNELQVTVRQAFADGSAEVLEVDRNVPPMLIRSWNEYNIVSHRGQFSAIPQAVGPIDLTDRDPHSIPGSIVRDSYESLRIALSDGLAN